MSDGNERAMFFLADGRIEIGGSETFVAGQLAKLESLLHKMFEQRAGSPAPLATPINSSAPASESGPGSANAGATAEGTGLNNYMHVFQMVDGKVQLLQKPPGKAVANQAQSVALLVTYANDLRGVKTTSIDEIRAVCQHHSCLDSGNFAKIFKNAAGKEFFAVSATTGVALTFPGRERAKEVADLLNK